MIGFKVFFSTLELKINASTSFTKNDAKLSRFKNRSSWKSARRGRCRTGSSISLQITTSLKNINKYWWVSFHLRAVISSRLLPKERRPPLLQMKMNKRPIGGRTAQTNTHLSFVACWRTADFDKCASIISAPRRDAQRGSGRSAHVWFVRGGQASAKIPTWMRDKREHGPGAPFRLCFPQLGLKAKWLSDRQEKAQRRVTEERGRPVCALDMEMTNYDLPGDSKLDCVNLGGLISRNGGDASKVSVPVAQRTVPMEGDNLYRLRDRKFLLEDKKRLCALALGTAVLGIVLMIIHAETCPYKPVGTKRIVSSRSRTSFNVLDFPPQKSYY